MSNETSVKGTPSIVEFTTICALLMIPSFFFVTRQSLWIDEAASCWFADHAHHLSFGAFAEFDFLAAVPQMPLFHLLLMIWVRIFGDSEQALRCINLPFAALFLGSIAALCRRSGERWWWLPALPFAVFPLLTYYVNECRPYTALLGLSTASAASLFIFLRSNSRIAAYLCSLFCLTAFAMHLLGILAPFILFVFIAIASGVRTRLLQTWKTWIVPLGLSLPGYVALLIFYAQVRGAGIAIGGSIKNPETPGSVASNWKNICFFFYETLGFSGLGPPRNALRIHANLHKFAGYAAWLSLGVLASTLLGILLYKHLIGSRGNLVENSRAFLASSMIGLALLYSASRAPRILRTPRHGHCWNDLLFHCAGAWLGTHIAPSQDFNCRHSGRGMGSLFSPPALSLSLW